METRLGSFLDGLSLCTAIIGVIAASVFLVAGVLQLISFAFDDGLFTWNWIIWPGVSAIFCGIVTYALFAIVDHLDAQYVQSNPEKITDHYTTATVVASSDGFISELTAPELQTKLA